MHPRGHPHRSGRRGRSALPVVCQAHVPPALGQASGSASLRWGFALATGLSCGLSDGQLRARWVRLAASRGCTPDMSDRPSSVQERRAIGYALGAVALWSTVATGFKLGLRSFEAVQLLFLGCVVALIFFAIARTFVTVRLTGREHLQAALLGLLNPLAYYLILFEAYDRLPAQVAQPLNYTWAITLALLAIPLLRQRLTASGWVGVLVGYLGVVMLVTQGSLHDFGRFDSVGIALAMLSTVLWAAYWILTVRVAIHPVPLMLNGFLVATPFVGLACLVTTGLPEINAQALGFALWVGLVEIGIAFLLWQRALTLTKQAGRIGQLIFLSPLVSLMFIALILGETIHPSAVIGLALIVAGLVLSRR